MINRIEELKALRIRWRNKKPEFAIIYGKRRVGKTTLIKEFIKNKPSLYFLGDNRNEITILRDLGRAVGTYFKDISLEKNGFSEWLEFFEYIGKTVKKRFILAIDEYPYLVQSNKALSSIFQKGWDEYLSQNPNIFIILCGSSISMMEEETLAHKSPLFDRRTMQILLKPLNFRQTSAFFPKVPFEKRFAIYSMLGGMPAYLILMNKDLSMLKNFSSLTDKTSYLYSEVEYLLQQELREPQHYLAILQAVAQGKRKFSEIIGETKLESTIVNKYLRVLQRLLLIQKEFPVTEEKTHKSKKGLYKISDNFVRFWFQHIFPFKSNIELGNMKEAVSAFKKDFNIIEAKSYEEIAPELIQDAVPSISFTRLGRWWDSNNEIDVVGLDNVTNTALFSEVKWSNKMIGIDIYLKLKEKSKNVLWHNNRRNEIFCLCSKKGFTKDMLVLAKQEKVILIEGEKMINGR
ncbi:ATP-binding protein [Candidatus Dojkabacteria bacterium]|nr:ATP-binding protein [Candidatus Dojkabacteria bacterium]